MNLPADQEQRTRFIAELDRNFSVVASAGSGKTRAITDRIVTMARRDEAEKWLPALVVVTYTNRAAVEMQQRARQSIIEADVRPEVLAAFNRAFFGTIHSLCMRLLRQHGHHLGLAGQIDHLDENNDAALWTEFLQQHTTLGATLDPEHRRILLRLAPARLLMELGRNGATCDSAPPPGPFPEVDFEAIHAFTPTKGSLNAVTRCREALRRWEQALDGSGFVGAPPACESKPLRDMWDAAVMPIRKWIQNAALHVAAETAQSYREFRLLKGAMTYSDQVTLAGALMRHPEAAQRIRAKNHRVILDEAQDTDPTQFNVLLEIARPPEAAGAWLEGGSEPPRPGHFCMVGDFQQSIYGARADLAHYRKIHDALQKDAAGSALEFSVTFRLDAAGLAFVNETFPTLLNGAKGQVPFVGLNPRPGVLPGQVARLTFDDLPDITDWKDWQKARWEAEQLAHWLREHGHKKLRASSWSEVALLCPRTRWLPVLRTALHEAGLGAQVQSERAIKGDSPAYAWFTALTVALAEPRNGYEIVGVLREVFGLSDQELATFAEANGTRFHLMGTTSRRGVVADTLNLLTRLRERAITLPLFTAMQEMARVTQLRDRLLALPAEDFDGLDSELETLLTQAATAEASGATLETFADDLRTGFSAKREVRATMRDAVQIISGHKAKGSEWDAVIVPFFARRVTLGATAYPRTLCDPNTRKLVVALGKGDIQEDLKTALDAQAQQELERVLYVALTRARHTLVLVDDRALFTGKSGLPKNAQAKLLHCETGACHAKTFDALAEIVSSCAITRSAQDEKTTRRATAQTVAPLAAATGEILTRGRERAANFIKRNPSALAEAAQADADPVPLIDHAKKFPTGPNKGQRYGTWWHNFIERLNWRAGADAWDATFAAALPDSPDAELSRTEWSLLRHELTGTGELARILTRSENIVHVEMPFLWAMNARECLDGIIDLAVLDPDTGRWLILDWKTNRTTEADLPRLHEHYLPQLSAYWRAVSEMLGASVSAGIYSTATARWMPYETDALAAAWHAMERNPVAIESALSEL